jgi:hypothetical protein
MSTRTTPRSARTRRTPSSHPSSGRFARSAGAPRRTPPRRYGMAGGVLQRRRTPPPSGLKGALAGLGGRLPAAGGRATPSSRKGKAGGVALLTAAAGFAFSNRDKLAGLVKRRGSGQETQAPASPPPPTTA